MIKLTPRHTALALLLTVAACGPGGGSSNGSDNPEPPPGPGVPPATAADLEVETYATIGSDGSWSRVDLVRGGVHGDDPTAGTAPNPALRAFVKQLMSLNGVDLNNDLADLTGGTGFPDGIADTGFDSYKTGVTPGSNADRILGANNLYDLFQTTTGLPQLANPVTSQPGGPPFTGGNVTFLSNGDSDADGGPGLFTNLVGTTSPAPPIPQLPTLPNAMGTVQRGPSATDQHQFIQIVFPYDLDRDSLFDFTQTGNSFLGDSVGAPDNVRILRKWISRTDLDDDGEGDDLFNVIDHTSDGIHASGVAIIGGVTAVPSTPGVAALASIDPTDPNIPEGARALIDDPRVFTYIAHEDPSAITQGSNVTTIGRIAPNADGVQILTLPDPTAGLGGRVFGANDAIPSAVNDFDVSGDKDAAQVGFISFQITRLRSKNETVRDPYFHTFPVDQTFASGDSLAVNGTFNRGPAVVVDLSGRPAIDVLDPSEDWLDFPKDTNGDGTPDVFVATDDTTFTASTRARFRVDFDKEVVPNSVGFSRRHTIHTVDGGVVFPFNGNTRPIASPAAELSPGSLGSPLAPSIYLAVNLPDVQVAVNNPYFKDVDLNGVFDDGSVISASFDPTLPGLFPSGFNSQATLPRGVVPCDIYPLNQNNLQAYVVQPLVELPKGSVVTLGVCMQGLGMSNNAPPIGQGFPAVPSNRGNYTRSGTRFTQFQGLTPVGVGDTSVSSKTALLGNQIAVKVNAGPMDLEGNLFFGGTAVAMDTRLDGLPNNDLRHGNWNVSRTFKIGDDNEKVYVNAPVAPQALVVGLGPKGLGVLDLNGVGFNTNAPGGAAENVGFESYLVSSRFLATNVSGSQAPFNWQQGGSLTAGEHQRGFGVLGRYTSAGCSNCATPSYESDLAIGKAIPTGSLTPVPGINEGSSGYETMVRDSEGSQLLTSDEPISLVRDILLGDFLDTIYFDEENPYAIVGNHRTYNTPQQTAVSNNMISDPPIPNPPPLRFPLGLPHTFVRFDQTDLLADPVAIEGNEVFAGDGFMRYDDGDPTSGVGVAVNGFIHLNPTANSSNANQFDVPHLPNGGFTSPFQGTGGVTGLLKFVQTGPMPKSSTTGAQVLTTVASSGALADPGGLVPTIYQSRQQIGNFLFVTDGVNKKLHAVNSNTMEVLQSLDLPDPYGLGILPNLDLLFVSNEGDDSVSVVDSDPRNVGTFMTELTRINVGAGPRAVAVTPDLEDVFVLNRLSNTISVIDVGNLSVRKTVTQSGLNRPNDITIGMREVGTAPGFQSGTFHAFISNGGGNSVLVYEGGPSGVSGIGFDNVLGEIKAGEPADINDPDFVEMLDPRGITYDPIAPLDSFAATIGCFVAHQHPITGEAMISRIAYTADSSPGQDIFNTGAINPGFGAKVFKITTQYRSGVAGVAHDVALPDYNRERLETSNFGTHFNLYNAGAVIPQVIGLDLPRNSKYPTANNLQPVLTNGPRWEPDKAYLAIQGGKIAVFELENPTSPSRVVDVDGNPTVLASYFGQ